MISKLQHADKKLKVKIKKSFKEAICDTELGLNVETDWSNFLIESVQSIGSGGNHR